MNRILLMVSGWIGWRRWLVVADRKQQQWVNCNDRLTMSVGEAHFQLDNDSRLSVHLQSVKLCPLVDPVVVQMFLGFTLARL